MESRRKRANETTASFALKYYWACVFGTAVAEWGRRALGEKHETEVPGQKLKAKRPKTMTSRTSGVSAANMDPGRKALSNCLQAARA
jgi:hypothetical protein